MKLFIPVIALCIATAVADTSKFNLYVMQVLDMRIPYTQHNVSFNVNSPNNTADDGGTAYALCTFGWTNSPPDCWTSCYTAATGNSTAEPSNDFIAHLDRYNGPDDITVSIWQRYTDSEGHSMHHNGTVNVQGGKNGYYCSHGAQTTQCSIGFPFNPIPFAQDTGDGCEPDAFSICA